MKKYLLLAICLMSLAVVKAQITTSIWTNTYTDGHLTVVAIDSMSHDSSMCQCMDAIKYVITIDSSYVSDSVRVIDSTTGILHGAYGNTTGVSPWVFTATLGTGGPWDNFVGPSGYMRFYGIGTNKITHHLDTLYIDNHDSIAVPNPCEYGTASGNIYIDNNSNCIFDAGDHAITGNPLNMLEHMSGPNPSFNWDFPNVSSTYSFVIQKSWMVDYAITMPAYYTFIFPLSPCFAGPYLFTTLPQTGVDFPLLCSSNVDVQCYALSPGTIRLHTPFLLHPYVSNSGCDTVSGQMTLVKDHRVTYNASLSSHPADYVYGDTLVWNYNHLSNVASGAYWNSFMAGVHLAPDTTVIAGDALCFRVYTNIPAADVNPANNDYTICLPVVYSYDPNLKEVSPKGMGPQGNISPSDDTLTYTLHFQNTGSAEAYDIKVIDTLNSHIIPSSLKILGTSHNMEPKWLTPNVVQFTFKNIHLPDSTHNEPASHGQVRFSVALNHGLAVGTQIRNTGYIYFDLNPPVVTNTTLNTILIPAGVNAIAAAPKIYPNPAADNITVENLKGGELFIVDMKGIIVLTQSITTGKANIDVSKLPAGVYLLRTVTDNNTAATRFTKY